MILAAGLGTRMRPLTDRTPKPLLKAAGKALIDFHIERAQALKIESLAINTHWLGEQVEQHIREHWRDHIDIHIFHEKELLETAGGIANALSILDSEDDSPFLLINGDVFFDADLAEYARAFQLSADQTCRLFLTKNPEHNPQGDFSFINQHQPLTRNNHQNTHTYSGIGLFRPSLFRNLPHGPQALGPILRELAERAGLYGMELDGYWLDVGTPERLQELNKYITASR